jgi:hypothetical protein
MSKKKLQIEGIMNELEGASLFFNPSSQSPNSIHQPTPVSENNQETNLGKETIPNSSIESPPSNEKWSDPVKSEPVQGLSIKQIAKNDEPITEVTNELPPERTNERYIKRRKIRHTFDIFADQLMSLREISIEEEKNMGERVLLGELAQQALDMFISKQRNK